MAGRDVTTGLAAATSPGGQKQSPDDVLVARAQQGDRAAFRQLIERHQRRLYQLALGIVKQHEDAMDVVQDTFVKVHQHLPAFKGEAAFSTWCYRIAYNLSIDTLRRTTRGETIEENSLSEEDVASELATPEHASPQKVLLRGELSAQLTRALESLSEAHRGILLLREVDGLSYEQISEVLEIPKGTVMSRLFHARHKMQEALKGYLTDEAPRPPPPAFETGGTRQ